MPEQQPVEVALEDAGIRVERALERVPRPMAGDQPREFSGRIRQRGFDSIAGHRQLRRYRARPAL